MAPVCTSKLTIAAQTQTQILKVESSMQVTEEDLQREERREEIVIHNIARLYGQLNLGKLLGKGSPEHRIKDSSVTRNTVGGGGDAYLKEEHREKQYVFFDNREHFSSRRL